MHRHALTDEQWAKIQPLLPGKRRGPKALRGDRHFIDAVLYRTRTGLPWRDLPSRFGPWKTIYNRFANWAKRGVWGHVFTVVQLEVEPSASIADASNVRAHQDAAGGKGGSNPMLWAALEEALRRSFTRSSIPSRARSTSR
jgi:transposase